MRSKAKGKMPKGKSAVPSPSGFPKKGMPAEMMGRKGRSRKPKM